MPEIRYPDQIDLSAEQWEVFNLRTDKNYLICGPPGTGKTVMAIFRSRLINNEKDSLMNKTGKYDYTEKPTILVKNKLLQHYVKFFAEKLKTSIDSSTYDKFVLSMYRNNINPRRRRPPYISSNPPARGDIFIYNWERISEEYFERGAQKKIASDFLIDEGQDIASKFFLILKLINKRSMTIFMDEYQTIFDTEQQQSTPHQLTEQLKIIDTEIKYLTYNYRNTDAIASVAKYFFTGPPEAEAEIPKRKGDIPQILKITDSELFKKIVRKKYASPNLTYGIFVPSRKRMAEVSKGLKEADKKFSKSGKGNIWIQSYYGKTFPDFNLNGIFILDYWSAKGLEFDEVFICDVDQYKFNASSITGKNIFYTLCARARERLYVTYNTEGESQLVKDFKEAINRYIKRETLKGKKLAYKTSLGKEHKYFDQNEFDNLFRNSKEGKEALAQFEKDGGTVTEYILDDEVIDNLENKIKEIENNVVDIVENPNTSELSNAAIRIEPNEIVEQLAEGDSLEIWENRGAYENYEGKFRGFESKKNELVSFTIESNGETMIFSLEDVKNNSITIYKK